MKLLGSTKSRIKKFEKGENAPHLEITEVVLIHFNIVNNDYQQYSIVLIHYNISTKIISKIQGFFMHLLLISHLVNY